MRRNDSSALTKCSGLLAWVLGAICHRHLAIAVNPWAPLLHGLSAIVPPACVMALPWVWEFSFSTAWDPDRKVPFKFHSVHPECFLFSLFCTLILRRLSWEEGLQVDEAWLSPCWLLMNYPDYFPAVAALCYIFSSLIHWEKAPHIIPELSDNRIR